MRCKASSADRDDSRLGRDGHWLLARSLLNEVLSRTEVVNHRGICQVDGCMVPQSAC